MFPDRGKTVTKPSIHLVRDKTRVALIRLAVELLQSLPFHLQFHLRVLLKYLCVALPQELGHPLVRHTPSAETRRVR